MKNTKCMVKSISGIFRSLRFFPGPDPTGLYCFFGTEVKIPVLFLIFFSTMTHENVK